MTLEDVFLDLTNRGRGNLWLKFFSISGSSCPVVVNGRRTLARYVSKSTGWELVGNPNINLPGDKDWPVKTSLVHIPLDVGIARFFDRIPNFP